MRLDNPGAPGAADLYLGALLPDGMTIVLWTGGDTFAVSHLDDVRTLRPSAAGVSLSTPFSSDTPSVVSHQWAAGDPRGHYVVFHLVTKAGTFEILSLATTSFAFP
jgi:hypothetical protein